MNKDAEQADSAIAARMSSAEEEQLSDRLTHDPGLLENWENANCPVCAQPLAGRLSRCRICGTLHHPECFEYNDGCGTYACRARRGWLIAPPGETTLPMSGGLKRLYPMGNSIAPSCSSAAHAAIRRQVEEVATPEDGPPCLREVLIAHFTKRALDRLGSVITQLRQQGDSEESILGMMRQQLKRFDPHTLRRIYERSLDNPLPDDFEAENVVRETVVKTNTIVLEVSETLGHLDQQSLVLYKGEEWFVQWAEGKCYTLRKIL